MRIAMSAAAGLAVFFVSACGSSNPTTSGSSTGPAAVTTGAASGTTTGGSGGTSGAGAGTTGTTTGTSLLGPGTACTSNDSCQSGVCGLDGTGNCCAEACKTDNATCDPSATCNSQGACVYPKDGTPCNSTCQYGMFTSYTCGGGACSAAAPVPCLNHLSCNAAGTACAGTCNPANGDADCALGWYCAGTTCTPQVQIGACASNAECQSNVCGVNGTGHCCTQSACTNVYSATNLCGTQDCDGNTGECTFPAAGTNCDTGPTTCVFTDAGVDTNVASNPTTTCDGDGICQPPTLTDCSPYACETNLNGCATSCTTIADCAKDFYCNGGVCIPQQAIGACTENDACLSLQCGGNGTGHCCFSACASTNPSCSITDCDANDGTCVYPGNSTDCGSVKEACSAGIQQNPSVCDGQGNCPAPGTTACTPFICGTSACLTNCTGNADCAPGASCAVSAAVCCPALLAGDSLAVDSQLGSDTAACCGSAGYTPCQTIGEAMSLIDAAQVPNVTINAYIGGVGNGGDWTFAAEYSNTGEPFPIKLGWGVELNAPGVNFAPSFWNLGENCPNCYTDYPEVIDVAQYSANDNVGYVSIVGNASVGNVQIGISASNGTNDSFNDGAVRVEAGQHLYLANAALAGYDQPNYYDIEDYSRYSYHAGLVVSAGGHATFGTDQSGAITGQVVLGNGAAVDNSEFWGCRGLVCETDGVSQGCTVDDVVLDGGASAVVIADNTVDDIEANDFASITLKGSPQIGNLPPTQGFLACSPKVDGTEEFYDYDTGNEVYESNLIWLNGQVTMTYENGTVSCGGGAAFYLNASPNGFGNPSLTLANDTIENTAAALYASAGSVSATKTSFIFNGEGVIQDTDGTNSASINLSGGGNTLACVSGAEGGPNVNPYYCSEGYGDYYCPDFGVAAAAVDRTSNDLDADDVAWDTKGPDLFGCTDSTLTSCTCENANCTATAGSDGMDAVNVGSGTVDTTGATVSTLSCNVPVTCGYDGEDGYCTNGDTCCTPDPEDPTYSYCNGAGELCED